MSRTPPRVPLLGTRFWWTSSITQGSDPIEQVIPEGCGQPGGLDRDQQAEDLQQPAPEPILGIGRRPAQRDDALGEEACGFLGTLGLIAGVAAEVQISDLLYDGGTNCTAGVQSPGNGNAVDVADADQRDREDEHPTLAHRLYEPVTRSI
jgi:hypothetical protein